MLEHVDQRVLQRGVVQRRHVPQVHDPQPDGDARPRRGERAERPLDPHQAPRGGAQDHARERQQQQGGGDVAQQHVLDHVGREQVLLAERVHRRGQRDQQGQHPGGEGQRLAPAGAAAAGLARVRAGSGARRSRPSPPAGPAPAGRAATSTRGSPPARSRDRSRPRTRLWHRRPTRNPPRGTLAPCPPCSPAWPPCSRRRSAGAAAPTPAGPSRSAGAAGQPCAGWAGCPAGGRARLVGGRLRGARPVARPCAEVPRRAGSGRAAGGGHRRRGAARAAGSGRGRSCRSRCPPPGAGAGLQPGRADRRGAGRAHRARAARVPGARPCAAPGRPRAPAAVARRRHATSA